MYTLECGIAVIYDKSYPFHTVFSTPQLGIECSVWHVAVDLSWFMHVLSIYTTRH